MITVCMATYNGEKYISQQILSILNQLSLNDELIISDDNSIDSTIEIINSFKDERIKLFTNIGPSGFVGNFENALRYAKGDIIFLSDQDDIWFENKLNVMVKFLLENKYDICMNNCTLTGADLNVIQQKFFSNKRNPKSYGFFGNLCFNTWLGCCMCFKRSVLEVVLPFPKNIVGHDIWIGLIGNIIKKVGYYDEPLQYYRRHDLTASFAGKKSKNPLFKRLKFRCQLLIDLFILQCRRKVR